MVFILSLLLCLLLCTACNTTKFVPQNQYLLNKAYVKVEDTKDVASSELRTYLQQKPNTEILGFWKLQLGIYNTASLDTTKWTSRNARKIGEAPVIFSPNLTNLSSQQLKLAMQNRGYFNADVDTTMEIKFSGYTKQQRKGHCTQSCCNQFPDHGMTPPITLW